MSNIKHLSPKFSHANIENVVHSSDWKAVVFPSKKYKSNDMTSRGDSSEQSNQKWVSGNYDALPEVPMLYPIQRTRTVVDDCTDPCTISNRITDCLRKLSITALYNSNDEPSSLLAETLDHTTFYIRLFKNTPMSNNRNRGVLVEIQRITGNSFNFVKYARDVLAAARGEIVENREEVQMRTYYIPTTSTPSSSCGRTTNNHECREPAEPDEECIILHIEGLLNNYRLDAVLLGIDSLLVLTDGAKSQVSSSVAGVVLRGNHGHSIIKDFIHNCIHSRPDIPREENAIDYELWHNEHIHNTALEILANSLHSLSADAILIRSLLQSEEWMGPSGIIDALLLELSHSEVNSHNAYHAARCLNTILDSSSIEIRKALLERGLSGVMETSHRVGQRKHLLLAQECDAALAVLAVV